MRRIDWVYLIGIIICLMCVLLWSFSGRVYDIGPRQASANNLKQIGFSLLLYHQTYGRLPPAAVCDKEGKPLYSWRVSLLPFLEQDLLYEEFHLDEPWDSPHNIRLLERMPSFYAKPWEGGQKTPYQVFVGPGTAFEREGLRLKDFTDDLGSTILVVEGAEPVPWTKPAELVFDPEKSLPALGGLFTGRRSLLGFEISRQPGFNAVFADGSVRFLTPQPSDKALRGMITRNGGEKVD